MSTRLSSWDPATQDVLTAIKAHNNKGLGEALDKWVAQKGEAACRFDMFFVAACEKNGAGIVRILVEHGFLCSEQPLELACSRGCWAVAKALLQATPPLYAPLVYGLSNFQDGHPLLLAIASAPAEVAKKILSHHKDPPAAAQAALHCLAYLPATAMGHEAAVSWLVQSGADPNRPQMGKHSPLSLALANGRVEMGVELVAQGATFSALEHASEMVMGAVFKSRIKVSDHSSNPLISPLGWELLNLAARHGVPMPQVQHEPWPHVMDFDRHTGKLYDADPQRLEALRQQQQLTTATPKPSGQRSPRL